jgi:hypothetical protein
MAAPLRLVFNPTGDLLSAARRCEADIFLQWYGNTRKQLADEYDRYEASSVFVALADEGDDVLGIVRFVVPGVAGLKTLNDVARPPWNALPTRSAAAARIDPATTWDCATMGLRSERSRSRSTAKLSLALYHGLLLALRVNQVHTVIAVLDERARRLLSSVGLILHPIPGTDTAPYLGSAASTPVFAHLAAGLDRQRRLAPEAHRLVTLGIGLDGVSVPEPDAFRWTPAPLVPVLVPIPAARQVVPDRAGSAAVGHLG